MLIGTKLTEVAFGEEQLDILIFNLCVQSLTEERGVSVELVSYRLLYCLNQLILEKGV